MGSSSFSFSSARHFDTAFPHLLFFFFSLLFFFFFPPKNNNAPQRRRHHFARPTMGLIRSLESKKNGNEKAKKKKRKGVQHFTDEDATGGSDRFGDDRQRKSNPFFDRSPLNGASSPLDFPFATKCAAFFFFLSSFWTGRVFLFTKDGKGISRPAQMRARPLKREKRREEKKQDFNDVVIVNCGASIESRCRDRGARCTHFQNKKKKKNKAKKKMTMVRVCKATTPFFFSFSWPSSAKTSSYSSSSSNARSICFSRG